MEKIVLPGLLKEAGYSDHYVAGMGMHMGAMVVGEAPGEQEDEIGTPFIGRSGQLLRDELEAAGINPRNVYITNVVKWRPPKNRTPKQDEIDANLPYLIEEVQKGVPRYILALGNVAFKTLVGTDLGVTLYRGFWQRLDEKFDWEDALVLPTFHPAYMLYNPGMLNTWRRDLTEFAVRWLGGV